jgi:2-oxoacid:acceptor oxidoreductase gamma subunit (pyruvate/2-ketoisovalerate family)
MIEIRFHGRGGQGAVVASNILANAAFREGKDVQSFPYFGVERRGSPVTAFTRIDDKPIIIRSQIYEPDYVIVMDPSLLKNLEKEILSGLKPNGLILINTRQKEIRLSTPRKLALVNATEIAIKHGLGSGVSPIVNTAILGAFAKASGIVKLESISQGIRDAINIKPENNVQAAKDSYDTVVMTASKT